MFYLIKNLINKKNSTNCGVEKVNNIVAFDIETKNLSTEIGGWGNTHMFLVSTVATWDGNVCKV